MKRIFLLLLVVSSLTSFAPEAHAVGKKKKKKIEAAIKKAKSLIGTPYKFGGTTRKGMDCSGLTSTAYSAAGVQLPRTSSSQSTFGKSRSTSALQKGDLVFFAMGKKKRKITHVGIVSRVKDPQHIYFIHASVSHGVIETNLMETYYKKRLRKARRIF